MLAGRDVLDASMQKLIDERARAWGITVKSVEIRDVVIPQGLEDAMSRRAQAEREKQARVILGDAEVEIAHKFAAAASIYHQDPIALQLRSLNSCTRDEGARHADDHSEHDGRLDGRASYAGLAAYAAQQQPRRRCRAATSRRAKPRRATRET